MTQLLRRVDHINLEDELSGVEGGASADVIDLEERLAQMAQIPPHSSVEEELATAVILGNERRTQALVNTELDRDLGEGARGAFLVYQARLFLNEPAPEDEDRYVDRVLYTWKYFAIEKFIAKVSKVLAGRCIPFQGEKLELMRDAIATWLTRNEPLLREMIRGQVQTGNYLADRDRETVMNVLTAR
jgi:hypothetical protein